MSDAPVISPSSSAEPLAEEVSLFTPWLLGWGAWWLGTFAVFHLVVVPAGFGHYERSYGGGLHFLIGAGLGALLFRRELRRAGAPGRIGWQPYAALLGGAALLLAVVAWAATVPLRAEVLARFEEVQVGVAQLNQRYFQCKLFDLLFQQTMIYVLVRRIEASGRRGWALCGAFALVFAGLHVPLVILKGWAGLPFVVLSACAALVFPPLISRFPGGIAYSYVVHLATYLILGVLIRVLQ